VTYKEIGRNEFSSVRNKKKTWAQLGVDVLHCGAARFGRLGHFSFASVFIPRYLGWEM
jgi:hypothetical protein